MAILTYSARTLLAKYLISHPLYLAIGKGKKSWDTDPEAPDYEDTELLSVIGYKKLTRSFFVNEDDNGEIDLPGGRYYSASEVPTRHASRGCGVHIHVGLKSEAGDHNAKTLTNLANIMAAHEEQIGRAIKIAESRTDRYCRTVSPEFLRRLNARKPQTMEQLANIWYEGNDANYRRNEHYNESRYHMLNYHACFTKGTIEFRLFQFDEPHDDKKGGIHCGQLKAYIQLCLAMSQLAKDLKFASPKPQQTENEKYAFRCWMLRLGFIGEEFKTARTLLLRNVSGNGAWRN